MRKQLLIVTALISAIACIVSAQDTPPATAVGPWRTGVSVTCASGRVIPANTVISGPNVTPEELCGSGSSSATSAGSNVKISNTGNMQQDLLTNGVNMYIAGHTANPIMSNFMQGAATGFISSMFANNAEAQRQQQLMAAEILRRQQELEQARRRAEQQRIDAMFARLNRELKLQGLPFNLSLKGMDWNGPDSLQLKGMSSSGPGDLQLKMSDSNPMAYGLKGLPGIYVGGPAGGDASSSGPSPETSTSAAGSGQPVSGAAANPNLASGPGVGTTGPGIPGLPGIYLDGVQPSQASQLAQAAQALPGPEKAVAEDAALHAAQNNPALTAPSQDPQVQNFQQASQDYQQALAANVTAKQTYETAQTQVEADQSAIGVARTQLNSITPSVQQQAAFNQMLGAAQTDEQASMLARQNFDSTEIHLSATRDRAAQALAQTVSSAAPSVDLRGTTSSTVAYLKTPQNNGFPVLPALHASTPKPQPVSAPLPTQLQLRARLEGMQGALRRLMEDEAKRGEARKDAVEDVNEAVDEAKENGTDMLFDLFLTGWDHCAPGVQGGVKGFFERHLDQVKEEIQDTYQEASAAKPAANLGQFNEKWNALDKRKLWLEQSVGQIESYDQLLTEIHATGDTQEIIEHADGSWRNSLEGLGTTLKMGLDDDKVRAFLGLSECGAVTVQAASSAIDSVYDIFKEGDAAESLRRTDENTMQFLTAQQSLNRQIKRTVAQLNCYKIPDAAGVVSCLTTSGQH
jgi:hypothetical protein